jgi:hypothetical protein
MPNGNPNNRIQGTGCRTVNTMAHTRPNDAPTFRGSGLPNAVSRRAIQWVTNGTHNSPTKTPVITAKNAGSEFMCFNDKLDQRGNALAHNEADLSPSSIPLLGSAKSRPAIAQ